MSAFSCTTGYRSAFILVLLGVTVLSLAQLPESPLTLWDKANHAFAYFVLLFLADNSFPRPHVTRLHPATWLGLFAYGAAIEIAQSQLPWRAASAADLVANATGLSLYAIIRAYNTRSRETSMTPTASLWSTLQQQALQQQRDNPLLHNFFQHTVLEHDTLSRALSHLLAEKLHTPALPSQALQPLFDQVLAEDPGIISAVEADLSAFMQRDCACRESYQAFCFYKGFHALAAYRLMHSLWLRQREAISFQLQQRISVVFDVDIHPAARIGHGILLDHATGIVIGETAVVGNHVSLMQGVTLGGTGKEGGDRHPKIRDGVLVSVGATILGNIEVGEGAQIAAGSVVLKPVPPHRLAAGVPAEIVGTASTTVPALAMDHRISG